MSNTLTINDYSGFVNGFLNSISKVSEEIGLEYQLNNRKEEDEAVNVMKEYGLQVNNLTSEQAKEWNNLVNDTENNNLITYHRFRYIV